MTEFFVGQKVVCVDDDIHMDWPQNAGHRPDPLEISRGSKYVVRWSGAYTSPQNGLLVHGVHLDGIDRGDPHNTPYDARRFRPLESKSIQLFRAIAQGVSDGKPIIPDDQPINVPAPVEGWTVESLTADILRRAQ